MTTKTTLLILICALVTVLLVITTVFVHDVLAELRRSRRRLSDHKEGL
jgi:hypothetical protein